MISFDYSKSVCKFACVNIKTSHNGSKILSIPTPG